ncbi:hypothetical protein TNCV_4496031 [Trichonephila clavipes]|nr:hypothetical protein TNCV_4496031 [Trichonephila clavipes]
MFPCIVIHKNEVCANGTSEQTHMGKKYLLMNSDPRLQILSKMSQAHGSRCGLGIGSWLANPVRVSTTKDPPCSSDAR